MGGQVADTNCFGVHLHLVANADTYKYMFQITLP